MEEEIYNILSSKYPPFNIFSIIGAVIVIIGLYLLLWGKEDPQPEMNEKEICCTTNEVHHEDPRMQEFASDTDKLNTEP